MAEEQEPSLSLEKYAAISRRLRGANEVAAQVELERHGLDLETWERASAGWRRALERDAEEGEGELLLRWAAARDAADAEAENPTTVEAAAEVSTAPKEPEQPVEPPAPVSIPVAVAVAKPSFILRQERLAALAAASPAPSPWAATASSIELQRHSTSSSFAAPLSPPIEAAPPSVPRPPPEIAADKWQEGETCIADDIAPSQPLPFAGPSSTRVPTTPQTAELPNPLRDGPPAPSTPFTGGAKTLLARPDIPLPEPPPSSQAPSPSGPNQTQEIDASFLRGKNKRPAPAHPFEPAKDSTQGELERYAALQAELTLFPQWAAAIRNRYGLVDEAAWQKLDSTWKGRLAADPGLYQRWYSLYTRYRAWHIERARSK
ncbi:MAG: hypothetical protein U0271_01245 [Polyangiaceae bacterium]